MAFLTLVENASSPLGLSLASMLGDGQGSFLAEYFQGLNVRQLDGFHLQVSPTGQLVSGGTINLNATLPLAPVFLHLIVGNEAVST